MFGKFVFLFMFILICSGCSSLLKTDAAKSPTPSVPPTTAKQIIFAPTYKSSNADRFHDAIEIYDSSPKASQGLYRYEGLVFVIVCIDTNREKLQYLEGTSMLRTAAILRKHYPGLPPTYHIRNRLVEKTFDDDTGVYRYATVYREKDIKRKSVD